MTVPLAQTADLMVDGDWVETKDQDPLGDVRLIQLADIGVGMFLNRSSRFLTSEKARQLKCTFLKPGDILIARMPDPIGRACIFPHLGRECVTAVDVSILRVTSNVDREYLMYWINSPGFRSSVRSNAKGATRKRISRKNLEKLPVALPDLTEQRRIVARIKECMERVEEIELLKQSLVNDYDGLKYSTVSHLVGELKTRFPSTTVGDLVGDDATAMRSGPFGSAMRHHEFVDDGNLVIGIANVQQNDFDPVRKWMISDEKFQQMKRYEVLPGDVLITIMGTIGRTCVVPEGISRAITSKHVYRIRFPSDKVSPQYISYIINFDFDARAQLFGTAIGGVMPGLNATKLRNLRICVPPLGVQEMVVGEIDAMHSLLSERAQLDSTILFGALRESILHQAFTGEL